MDGYTIVTFTMNLPESVGYPIGYSFLNIPVFVGYCRMVGYTSDNFLLVYMFPFIAWKRTHNPCGVFISTFRTLPLVFMSVYIYMFSVSLCLFVLPKGLNKPLCAL